MAEASADPVRPAPLSYPSFSHRTSSRFLKAGSNPRRERRHGLDDIVETLESDFFAAPERLGVRFTDRPTPIARPVADVVERAGKARGSAGHELTLIRRKRLHLGIDAVADVDDESRLRMNPQM